MPIRTRFPSCEGRTRTRVRALTTTLVVGAGLLASACLRRDVSSEEPTTKISFETTVNQPAVDKIDLLVMVDNSGSMADKQRILGDAVPDLVRGLIRPKCVDKKTREPLPGNVEADPVANAKDACPAGSEPAFPPVTDMHIGVISSSLGGFGSSSCKEPGRDDRGHLLARGREGAVAQAGDLHFLAWFPDVEANRDKQIHPDPPVPKIGTEEELSSTFRDLVVGVGQAGCGLEAQLESVYRFLIQPDPWQSIQVEGGRATYGPDGAVDEEILRQRAAFLRPDSLVAVIVLSDEDDSSADPLSFQGSGWQFMNDAPMPRGTSVCATSPADPKCTSCAFTPADPSCTEADGKFTAEQDSLNVRFQRMKQRFGVDPQYPIKRYVQGLQEPKVPRRSAEHDKNGVYRTFAADCTNPLYAARLPTSSKEELCKLTRGSRSSSSVYFAIIGGVPNHLLPEPDPNGISKIDWTRILGANPDRWDESGIDPHMIQSVEPRAGLPATGSPDDADPVHGREWDTERTDLQYACTFPLYEREGTDVKPVRHPCPPGDRTCDCGAGKKTPLCDPADSKIQIRGKAYPTRRELLLAKELGDYGIAASLCPKQLTEPNKDDYGYRPAVRAITDRLERARIGACVPRPLTPKEDGQVSCIVAAILPDAGPDGECQSRFGLANPRPEILGPLRDKLAGDEGEESRRRPICELPQLPPVAGETCRDEEEKVGFCYAENVPRASCRELLLFSKATRKLVNARFTMQCIQVSEGSN